MKICVFGLWHLGTVTAACLSSVGHSVVGLDFNAETIAKLQAGEPPLFEPGLAELVKQGIASGTLRFSAQAADALQGAEVVWVTFDTPVNEADQADVDFVIRQIAQLFPHIESGAVVLISSQLPVGSTRRLEKALMEAHTNRAVTFAYSPENLRLGKAIDAFSRPDRIVVGVRTPADRDRISALLRPITDRIEWMSVESAEMTKHALNAFLATSVVFINEIAVVCEQVGADAKEVERGLKSEARIGPKAFLGPGAAFAGGTLARDVAFLTEIGANQDLSLPLLGSIRKSNEAHKLWPRKKLQAVLGDLRNKRIAVWGLTYKPGTDTLRRSSSMELCRWLAEQGAQVQAFDPAVRSLPAELEPAIRLGADAVATLALADALVVATEWADFKAALADDVIGAMKNACVLDANRFLAGSLGNDARIRYFAVGKPE
jgi:UDPglucose 6-dehydrogenase